MKRRVQKAKAPFIALPRRSNLPAHQMTAVLQDSLDAARWVQRLDYRLEWTVLGGWCSQFRIDLVSYHGVSLSDEQ